jgi:hypothetical protein
MGVHDFCCHICSRDNQTLIIWDNPRQVGSDEAHLLIFDDPDGSVKSAAELLSTRRTYRSAIYRYDWNEMNFEGLDYEPVITEEGRWSSEDSCGKTVWYSNELHAWIINLCFYCFDVLYSGKQDITPAYEANLRKNFSSMTPGDVVEWFHSVVAVDANVAK